MDLLDSYDSLPPFGNQLFPLPMGIFLTPRPPIRGSNHRFALLGELVCPMLPLLAVNHAVMRRCTLVEQDPQLGTAAVGRTHPRRTNIRIRDNPYIDCFSAALHAPFNFVRYNVRKIGREFGYGFGGHCVFLVGLGVCLNALAAPDG